MSARGMSATGRRAQLGAALKGTLARKFGDTPEVVDAIEREVANFVQAGRKINAPAIKALQQKLSNQLIKFRNRSGRMGSSRGSSALRATGGSLVSSGRHRMPRAHGHQQDVYDEVPAPTHTDIDLEALQTGRRGGGRSARGPASARGGPQHSVRYADQGPPPADLQHYSHGPEESKYAPAPGPELAETLPTVPQAHRPSAQLGMAHTGGMFHVAPGGSPASTWRRPEGVSLLDAVKDEVLADPEPEVVEHVIQEVKARRQARAEQARRKEKQLAMQADLERMRRERAMVKAMEAEEDAEYLRIEQERTAEENRREDNIRAGIKTKEAAQRADRMAQIQAHQARLRAEKEHDMEHDKRLVQRAVEVAKAEEEEELADRIARRAEVRKVMTANEQGRKDRRAIKAAQHAADKKLMEAYNKMEDEQAEAREAAISAVYRRHDTMHQMANQRKALETRRATEEKARIRREYEAMMDRVAKAEAADREWKRQERAAMRAALDAQVAAKAKIAEREKVVGERQMAVFKARAAAALVEEEEERLAALKRKEWFARQLDKQRDAKAKVGLREQARKRAAAVARLAEVEDDESVLEEVAQELTARGRGRASAGQTLTAHGPRRDNVGRAHWEDEKEEMTRLLTVGH